MATSTEQELQKDKFVAEMRQLEEVLDAIPFTQRQRSDINYRLDRLLDLFSKANV